MVIELSYAMSPVRQGALVEGATTTLLPVLTTGGRQN